jgi:hypothetical protein
MDMVTLAMTRKVLALTVILIISALAPATAVIGFCAKMPCCVTEGHESPALAAAMGDCCTPVNCYESPSHELTFTAKAKAFVSTAAIIGAPLSSAVHAGGDTGAPRPAPPPHSTRQRLSALSLLLI